MSKTIWKFDFKINDRFVLQMPRGARILSVQTQRHLPVLWAEVDPQGPQEPYFFEVFGTGHPIEHEPDIERSYVGTIQQQDGHLVWHIYQRHH